MFDLEPSTAEMTRLLRDVRDEQLDDPTPCSEWTVADLLAHVHQFASVFTANAGKTPPQPPDGLVDDWRTAIPTQLDDLAEAWRQEAAWEGRVAAGGVDMAAADNAVVAVEELTTHGWDLARATGQQIDVEDASLDRIDAFFELFGEGPFEAAVAVPDDASRLERTLARTGRDPQWRTPG